MMFVHRTLLDRLESPVSAGKVRLLFRARQTGKTELLRHLLAYDETAVFDLDDTSLRRRLESDRGTSAARSARSTAKMNRAGRRDPEGSRAAGRAAVALRREQDRATVLPDGKLGAPAAARRICFPAAVTCITSRR
jgi:hypothetical protein